MNSTGQNLGVNPLMGATDTAVATEAVKSVPSVAATEDKSLKNKGFSDYMDGQADTAKPTKDTVTEDSVEEAAVVEASETGSVINTAAPAPKTLFAAERGSVLPADGSPLPSGETLTVATPKADGLVANPINTATVAQTQTSATNEQSPAAVVESKAEVKVSKTVETAAASVERSVPAATPSAVETGSAPTTTPVTPTATPVNAEGKPLTTNTVAANSGVTTAQPAAPTTVNTKTTTGPSPVGSPANAGTLQQPVSATSTPIVSTTEAAVVESVNGNKAATLSSLQESPLGLRIKPQMTNNPSGIATIETAFTETKDAAAPTVSPLLSTEAPQAYRSYSETGLQTAVSVPVGKPGWSESVMQRVMWMSSQNISKAEIALDPPELGPMNVKISSSGEQTSVVFTSNHAAVRDALDQGLPRLREMMENQGVDLADVDVSDQNASREQQQANAEQAQGEVEGEQADNPDVISGEEGGATQSLSLVDQYV